MSMQIERLAHTVTSVLVPALPLLVRAKDPSPRRRAATRSDLAQELWARLWPRIRRRASAREALADAARVPQDQRASHALELQLEKILTVDGHLAGEVENLLFAADAEGETGGTDRSLRRAEEIAGLYRNLHQLMACSEDRQAVEPHLSRLRSLQKEEAAEMLRIAESRLHLKPGEGYQALREARQLLSRDEDPASADFSPERKD